MSRSRRRERPATPLVAALPPTGRVGVPWWVAGTLTLVVLVLVAYAPVLRAGFIRWDDANYVELNPLLRSTQGLWQIWSYDQAAWPHAVQWYPLTHTTYWLEYRAWGADPRGYHVTNVGLHALNAVLVWLLLRRLAVPGAFIAALLFAVHPVQVQSVAWIAERKNLLAGLFLLLTGLAWLRFVRTGAWWAYAAALLLFAGGLFSKTAICTLPVILLAWVWWKRPTAWRRTVLAVLPFFVLAAVLALATMQRERGYTTGDKGFGRDLTLPQQMLIAGRALWFYAYKLLVPLHLTPIYPRWTIDPHVAWQWLFPLAAAGVAAAAWFGRRRLGCGTLFALLFFAISLGPVLGFVDFGFFGLSYVTDHFQYWPCLGLLALLAAGGATLVARIKGSSRAIGPVLVATVIAFLGVRTWQQSAIYQDPLTFWRAAAAGNSSPYTLSALGDAHLRAGDLAGAERCLRQSLELQNDALTHFRLAELHTQRAEYKPALQEYQQAFVLNRSSHVKTREMDLKALLNMGHCCWFLGDFVEAAKYYEAASRVDPQSAEAGTWLAKARARSATSSAPQSAPSPFAP